MGPNEGTEPKRKATTDLGRLWVCAEQGGVEDVGGDAGACRPLDEAGRAEAWGRKVAPWWGAERQEVEEVGEVEEGGLG